MAASYNMESPEATGSRDLAAIVHDFNNLLGVVLNFTILARERLAAAPESGSAAQAEQVLRYLERVERAARSAVQLTKELGALTPPKRPEPP